MLPAGATKLSGRPLAIRLMPVPGALTVLRVANDGDLRHRRPPVGEPVIHSISGRIRKCLPRTFGLVVTHASA
jgi:hypothetical protein